MALFALLSPRRHARRSTAQRVNDWIAGNLCRCTGYRPIVDAALAVLRGAGERLVLGARSRRRGARSPRCSDSEDIFIGTQASASSPRPPRITALAKLYYANPDATLVAGATDVGLWITKQLRDLPKVIWLGRVKGLDEIEDRRDAVSFGATVTHTEAMPYLAAIDRDLGELMRRFAGTQVRMAATVGGNIANGSPIGDLPPALIALGATLGAAARRPAAHAAAGGLLHRLRQAGPPAGRVRARGARPEARRGRAFPLLQDLQALRPGHFRRDGRVQAARSTARASRARASPSAAWRRPRSARAAAEKALIETQLDATDATGTSAFAALARGLHAARRPARQRALSPRRRRARCCARR